MKTSRCPYCGHKMIAKTYRNEGMGIITFNVECPVENCAFGVAVFGVRADLYDELVERAIDKAVFFDGIPFKE